MSYTSLDSDGFPSAPINVGTLKQLIFFNSWETAAVAKIFYYVAIAFLVLTAILHVIFFSIARGIGGFFMAFFSGLFTIVAGFLVVRLICEMFLAIQLIRQNHTGSGSSSAKPTTGDNSGFSFGKDVSPFDKGTSFSAGDSDSYQQV